MPPKRVTQKQQRGRNLDGNRSRFQDKGAFGCVYQPAIPCQSWLSDPAAARDFYYDKHMSKVFYIDHPDAKSKYHEEAERYKTATDILGKRIPKFEVFCQTPENLNIPISPIPKNHIEKEKEFVCHRNSKNKDQIIFEYGGINLDTLLGRRQENILTLLPYFKNIFKSIEILQKHNKAHKDVKPANIVFDAHETYPLKLIDFGELSDLSDVYTRQTHAFLQHSETVQVDNRNTNIVHPYYPPEARFLKNAYSFLRGTSLHHVQRELEQQLQYLVGYWYAMYAPRIRREFDRIVQIRRDPNVVSIMTRYVNSLDRHIAEKNSDAMAFSHYMIGAVNTEFKKVTNTRQTPTNTQAQNFINSVLDWLNRDASSKLDVFQLGMTVEALLFRGIRESTGAFLNTTAVEKTEQLLKLIYAMTRSNPNHRISISSAYRKLNNILNDLNANANVNANIMNIDNSDA